MSPAQFISNFNGPKSCPQGHCYCFDSSSSIAAGLSQKTVIDVLMAAAASDPVQTPRTMVSDEIGNIRDPSLLYLGGISIAWLEMFFWTRT